MSSQQLHSSFFCMFSIKQTRDDDERRLTVASGASGAMNVQPPALTSAKGRARRRRFLLDLRSCVRCNRLVMAMRAIATARLPLSSRSLMNINRHAHKSKFASHFLNELATVVRRRDRKQPTLSESCKNLRIIGERCNNFHEKKAAKDASVVELGLSERNSTCCFFSDAKRSLRVQTKKRKLTCARRLLSASCLCKAMAAATAATDAPSVTCRRTTPRVRARMQASEGAKNISSCQLKFEAQADGRQ